MRSVSSELDTLLRSTEVDLDWALALRIALADGTTVLRWTDHAENLSIPDQVNAESAGTKTFATRPDESTSVPLFEFGTIDMPRGGEVSTCAVTLFTGGAVMLGGIPLTLAVARGKFDRASAKLWLVILSSPTTMLEAVPLFEGQIDRYEASNTEARLTVTSAMARLNRILPAKVISASCPHTLYDAACGVSQAANTAWRTVQAGSTAQVVIGDTAVDAGWWDLGVVTFETGAHTGERRVVRAYAAGDSYTLSPALPSPPAPGDVFRVTRGCDRTLIGCGKFANTLRFGGQPFAPRTEEGAN